MLASFKAAVETGINPSEFWNMTPYLTRLAMTAARDGKNTRLWMLACLIRARQMPKLEKFLSDSGSGKKNVETGLKNALSGICGKKNRK